MDEVQIIRLNIERFRQMLRTETDATLREAIQGMLDEFEAKLSTARRLAGPRTGFDPHQSHRPIGEG